MIYLLTAIGLTPGGNSAVHIYTQTIYKTKQMMQNTQNGTHIKIRMHNITKRIHNLQN